ncbi:MAG: C13 family peptidase [Pseudomonadota bacterium]
MAGLRAALCLRVEIGHAAPSPLQLLCLVALPGAVHISLARLEIPGDAIFNISAWLQSLYGTTLLIFLLWATLASRPLPQAHPAPVTAWLALSTVAMLPLAVVGGLMDVLAAHERLPSWWLDGDWQGWVLFVLLWLWLLVAAVRITACFTPSHSVRTRVVVGVLLIQTIASLQPSSSPWQPDHAALDQSQSQNPGLQQSLTLSQEVFEDQQALLHETLAAITPRQANRVNVFGLVYAPYAQSVFVRESAMVTGVLQERFGARGRVVQLVNHASVTASIPWATNQNLQASLKAIAQHMDRERDVLVVYLSSHGGSDFKLASAHEPLQVEELTPQLLRAMLDEAGVRNRVIAVSACYSGGWVDPLATDSTLVMTAADATHTSYGCGSRSELTFFGRALFDEQLRKTHSFESAFSAAVPIIQQREIEGKKEDGFSNPQIAVGKSIRPVLTELEQELNWRTPYYYP